MKRFLQHINFFHLFFPILLLFSAPSIFTADAKPQDKLMNRPYADLKRWHLGFSVGMHVQDLSFTHNGHVSADGQKWVAEVPSFSPGFCVNVLGALRLHKYLELRFSPGMYFGSKGVTMRDYESGLTRTQDVKSAYVALPVDLKISGDRMRNVRPYVLAGTMGTFDVSKKRTEILMFNKTDVYLSVGLGVDFYLPYFKLNPELKFCFGLTDVLKHNRPDLTDDPESLKMPEALSKVKSSMVVLTFYFE
ncbi:MAG: PorT family protein [Muribaculaceae bacterium]|nr:PorT family protein [Muribaculaceae bacterium]